MRQAVIVSGVRTAVGKAIKGSLRNYRSDEMGATVVKELLHGDPQNVDVRRPCLTQ